MVSWPKDPFWLIFSPNLQLVSPTTSLSWLTLSVFVISPRLAAGVFLAVDFLADRAGVAFRTGVDGVADAFPPPAPFLAGVLAMVMMGDRFVSSDFSSLFIRCVDTAKNQTARQGMNQE